MSLKCMSMVFERLEPRGPVLRLVLLTLADIANNEGVCWPSVDYISARAGVCERSVQRAIRRLEKLGFISIQTGGRTAKGGKRSSVYTLMGATESPIRVSASHPEGVSQSPTRVTPSQSMGDSQSKRGCQADTPTVREPSENHNTEPSCEPGISITAEIIYEAYPRHIRKTEALAAINELLAAGQDPAHLLDRVQAYAAAVTAWQPDERKFIPYPATWFEKGRFADDPKEWRTQHPECYAALVPEVSPERAAKNAYGAEPRGPNRMTVEQMKKVGIL